MINFLRAVMLLVIIVGLIIAGVSTALTKEITRKTGPAQTAGDRPVDEAEEIEFTIEPEETLSQVASRLRANGIIRYPLLFRLVVLQQGLGQSLQAGIYKLRQGMSMSEVIAALRTAPSNEEVVTPDQPTEKKSSN